MTTITKETLFKEIPMVLIILCAAFCVISYLFLLSLTLGGLHVLLFDVTYFFVDLTQHWQNIAAITGVVDLSIGTLLFLIISIIRDRHRRYHICPQCRGTHDDD